MKIEPNHPIVDRCLRASNSLQSFGFDASVADEIAVFIYDKCHKSSNKLSEFLERALSKNPVEDKDDATLILELVHAAIKNEEKADPSKLQVTDWVLANIAVPWDMIDKDSVPSRGAVGFLQSAKESPDKFLLQWLKDKDAQETGSDKELSEDDRTIRDVIRELAAANQEDLPVVSDSPED